VDGKDTTPYEGWHKRKPDLSYIRRFGSTAFVAVPKEQRHKLDDKAKKLIFVGYEMGTKGYRLLDVNTNRIQVSKDVFFLEGDPHLSEQIWHDADLVDEH